MQTGGAQPIHEITGWRRLAIWMLASLVRVWSRTLRFECDEQSRDIISRHDRPVALVLWHNRLFVSAEYFRRYRRHRAVYALVSASKDGAWLAAFYRMIGISPVRGSSSNHGREAARTLIDVLRNDHDIGITPDGPRGPLYAVEPGVVVITRRAAAPMILLGFEFARCWRLRSWDRFYVPWPFSRVILRGILIEPAASRLDPAAVQSALRSINPDPQFDAGCLKKWG